LLELSIDDAMTAIEPGEIADGKTIILLQYAYVHLSRRREQLLARPLLHNPG
jgi:hypothetical protein